MFECSERENLASSVNGKLNYGRRSIGNGFESNKNDTHLFQADTFKEEYMQQWIAWILQ